MANKEVSKKIFSILSEKVELSEQKIQMALVDDITNEYKQILKGSGNILSFESELDSIALKITKAKESYQSFLPKIQKAVQMAKELGANDIIKTLSDFEQSINDNIKKAQKYSDSIKSLF